MICFIVVVYDHTIQTTDSFALSFNRANKIALDTAFINNSKFDSVNVLISAFTLDFEPELRQALQQLQSELPEPEQDRKRFENW